MPEEVINIENLNYSYKNQKNEKALKNINLSINEGDFIVVMGHSGAGKSTLCFSLNGLIPNQVRGDYDGKVEVRGVKTEKRNVSDFAEEIGIVFQNFEIQLFSTNVKLEVAFGPENFAVSPEEIHRRVKESLEVVGLEGFEKREPSTLSGGQKQRLAIASMLSIRPNIIVLDEPTTDLDPLGKRDIFNIAKKLRKDNMTMIIAEHETEETLAADKIIVLNEGEICGTGTPREILSQIEFLRENAIKPLQITEFFQPYFDKDDLPLTVEQGLKAWDELNFSINPGKYENLVEKDLKKEKKYGDPVVEVENLGHVYEGGVEALKDASFEIKKGEFVAVVGQNGSGKTTLVKHLNGLLKPTSGKVIIDGEDTKNQTLRQLSRKVGYVFQNPDHQIFEETVFDEVAFGPELQGQSEEEIKKNVNEALESVALKEFSDEDPFSLSKGERQRVAVASILATQPEVIILDEPTTGLDYHQIESMMKLITNLNKAGHTIIMVTHTMWVVAKYAHRAIVLKDGEIILNDRIRKVFEKEDVLNNAFLKPPQIVQFSNKLDNTVLTVDELKQIAERGD